MVGSPPNVLGHVSAVQFTALRSVGFGQKGSGPISGSSYPPKLEFTICAERRSMVIVTIM
jgi:hypothetical protein